MKFCLIPLVFLFPLIVYGQGYKDSMNAYHQNYIDKHEAVIKDKRRKEIYAVL
jgi:hypothetical protein